MDCAIYIRVSQEKQAKEGHSLEAQEKEGIRVCGQAKLNYEVFPEPGKSANKESLKERPALNKILDLAEEGKINYCFVTELDRLSRNPVTLAYIKRVFLDNNVKILTPNQTFDLKDDEDDFISDLLGLLAKRENRLRVKRSQRSMLESVLKGGWQGGMTPFGYRRENKKLAPDPEESRIYNMMVDWNLEGRGSNTIARMLNNMGIATKGTKAWRNKNQVYKWKAGVVLRILKNPLYKGDFTYKGNKVKMPALVSAEKWQAVQDNLQKNYNNARRNKRRFYLLRGLLYCKRCGRRLFGKIKESSHERLYCCVSKRPDPEPRFCGLRSVNLDNIENAIWEKIKEIVKNPEKLKKAIEQAKDSSFVDNALMDVEIEKINRTLNEKERAIDVLVGEYARGTVKQEYLDRNIKILEREKEDLLKYRDEILERAERAKTAKENLNKIENYMAKLSKRIDNFTEQEKYDFLHLIINKITVDYGAQQKKHYAGIDGAIPIFENVEIENPAAKSCRKSSLIYPPLQHSDIAGRMVRITEWSRAD